MTDKKASSRRRLLTGGAAVVGSAAGAVLLGSTSAEAADGNALLAGRANTATAATSLTNSNAAAEANGLVISTKGGHGIHVTSETNHGIRGSTKGGSKVGVIAVHDGPAGGGSALLADGRKHTAAWIRNADTDNVALLVTSNWANPADKEAVAIRAVTSADKGRTISSLAVGRGSISIQGEAEGYGTGGDFSSTVYADSSTDPFESPVALHVDAGTVYFDPEGNQSVEPGTALGGFGNVMLNGRVYVTVGVARLDDWRSPTEKYINHPMITSDEMVNVYSGTAKANASGEAVVQMPEWFETVNSLPNIRYQLTAIGAAAPDLHVKTKITDRTFTIAGAKPQQEICWQVTSPRRDIPGPALAVVEPKPKSERGTYLNPQAFGQPESKRLGYRKPPKRDVPN